MPKDPPGTADRDAEKEADPEDRDAVSAAIDVLREMAEDSANAMGNCEVAASMISSRVETNARLWQQLAAISNDAQREKVLAERQSEIDDHVQRFADALGPCSYDERIRSSLRGMSGFF